jgi:hypothetical protein
MLRRIDVGNHALDDAVGVALEADEVARDRAAPAHLGSQRTDLAVDDVHSRRYTRAVRVCVILRPVERGEHFGVACATPSPEPRLPEQQVGQYAHDRQREQQHDPCGRDLRPVAAAVQDEQAGDHADDNVRDDRKHHRRQCVRAGVDQFRHVDAVSARTRAIR